MIRTVTRQPDDRLPRRSERRLLVLDQFRRKPFLTVGELSETLGVSSITVRRDLRQLADEGLVRHEHGGALLVTGPPVAVFHQRETARVTEKKAIGLIAARQVNGGEVVGLDSGTTALAVAQALHPPERLTVVTHSLPAIVELASRANVEVIGLGGLLQERTLAFAGPAVTAALRTLRLHTLFLAATGCTFESGMTCVSLLEADTKRAFIEAAQRVVLVADSSKFGRVFPTRVAALDVVHEVITDAGLPDSISRDLEAAGIRVHRADPATGTDTAGDDDEKTE